MQNSLASAIIAILIVAVAVVTLNSGTLASNSILNHQFHPPAPETTVTLHQNPPHHRRLLKTIYIKFKFSSSSSSRRLPRLLNLATSINAYPNADAEPASYIVLTVISSQATFLRGQYHYCCCKPIS